MIADNYEKMGIDFFNKINYVRESPVSYSLEIEKFRESFKNNEFYIEKNTVLPTTEGRKALEDLIKHMETKKPMNKLKMEKGLNLVCRDFCTQAKDSNDMNELNSTYNFEKQFKKYGKIGAGRYLNIITNFISDDVNKNVLILLSCDGDDTREYRDLLTSDNKVKKFGIHVTKYPKESSPIALILLVDDFTPSAEYENDHDLEKLISVTKKLNLNEKNNKAQANNEDDPDLDLPAGVVKVEKKSKVIKEGNTEFIVTKTITYMEDGSVNTEITKEKK